MSEYWEKRREEELKEKQEDAEMDLSDMIAKNRNKERAEKIAEALE